MTTMNASELKKALESADIFSRNGFSRDEYIEELLKFQSFASQMILDDETARLDEVIAAVSSAARKNGATASPDFVAGIRGLKAIEKEIAIHMSGKRAEDEVAHSLTFVDRPFFQDFRNVYVSDQETETEIDNVILTNNGIIVVEVKSAKQDITIGEDGRLLYSNSESYHNESIGDKMSAKRKLLKARIENGLRERGLNIPVYIDSYLVFVTPKRLEVDITDNFRKEHWCRRGKLQHIVNNYISDVTYTAEEYAQLAEVIDALDCNVRRFPAELDLPGIRDGFVSLFSLITKKTIVNEAKPQNTAKVQLVQTHKAAQVQAQKHSSKKWSAANIAASVAVILVASVAAVTAAVHFAS
jgi:hypothetical protein